MASRKNHVLVPVDFSAQSQIALEQALRLADVTGAPVTILYVTDVSGIRSLFTTRAQVNKYNKDIQKKLDKMAALARKGSKAGPIDTLLAEGKVYDEIVDTAKKLKSRFIVMGKSDSNMFIGSNTMRVVRESPCPVISIKGSVHRPYCKNIVLPLDITTETREKVANAITFAKLYGSMISVIAVHSSDDEYLVKKLKAIMNQVRDYISSNGVTCNAEIIPAGNVAKAVVNYSKKVKADLIMIMTQQERDFTDLFIGSSAQQIINTSDIPVLSITPSGKEYQYSYSVAGLYS